jgi:asparagine synthase (glutamine-hydrolysing)
MGVSRFGDKITKTALRLKNVNSIDALYKTLVSEWPNPDSLVKGGARVSSELINLIDDQLPQKGLDSSESRMMYWDTISYLPDDILCKVDRPKAGFGIPLGAWLRGPLRPWVEELINYTRLEQEGYLEPQLVNKIWNEHISGKRDWSFRIWSVVIFQQWLESIEQK